MNKHYLRDSDNPPHVPHAEPHQRASWGLIAVALLFAFCAWLFAPKVHAQTAPTCVLTTSTTKVISPGSVALGWSSTGAAACTATSSGNQTAWQGAKNLSGSQTLTGMRTSSDYTLMCAAAQATNGVASLSWAAPTTNTDGSALSDLAGYKVYASTSSAMTSNTLGATVSSPSTLSTTVSLAAGTWYFGVTALNSKGAESALSNIASKTVTIDRPATCTSTVHVDVSTVPSPPVLATVDTTAYEINKSTDALALNAVGTVALGVSCKPEYDANGLNVVPRDQVKFKTSMRPLVVVAKCG